MIKKISIILFLYCILVSCGKKGDPEYQDPKKKTKLQTTLINNS